MAVLDGDDVDLARPADRWVVRQAPEGDDLADRAARRQLDQLGDDGDAPRDGLPVEVADRHGRRSETPPVRGSRTPVRTRSSVDLPAPFGPTRAIRSPAIERQGRVGDDRPVAERDRDAVRGEDRAHSSYPEWVWWSRTRKNGAPRMAMTTPTGRSPRSRATRSAEIRRTAPKIAEIGTTRRAAGPDEQPDDVRDDQADEPDQAR